MYLIVTGIRQATCTNCGRCVADCPQGLFSKNNGQVLFHDPIGQCMRCGHCIAVCPENTVIYRSSEPVFENPDTGRPSHNIDEKTLEAFMRSRRSVRQFIQDPLPENIIASVLDAMRHGYGISAVR